MAESSAATVTCPVLVLRVETTRMSDDTLAEAMRDEFLTRWGRSEAQHVVIDLGTVTYLSTAGFRPLLTLLREVRRRGGRMVLCRLSELVADVFLATRLLTPGGPTPSVFEAQPDVPAAVATLLQRSQDDTAF
jgi:anti-anti-sigma factor